MCIDARARNVMLKAKSLKYIFAVLVLGILVYFVDVRELWQALSELTYEIVLYLALLSVALIYISALKWKLFIEAFNAQASVARLFQLYLVGYFVNLLAPSYVGGDIVRSWYLGKRVGQHEALAATILERYTGFVAMVSLSFVFMWSVERVTFEIKLVVFMVALGLLAITVLALSEKMLVWFERFIAHFGEGARKSVQHVRKIQDSFRLVKSDRKLLVKALALSFLFHSLAVVNTVAAAYAVGWFHPPIWELFVVLPLILLIGAIPVAPSGLGIQEGAFLFFLQGIGASPAQALGVGIVLRAKSYVLALCGGLIWLSIRGEGKADTEISPV